MIRVWLPGHLRTLAHVTGEVEVEISGPASVCSVLDALEERFPMLKGTLRDHVTRERRPYIRFFACEQDLSLDSPDNPLPEAVASGVEPLLIVGAIAGGSLTT
jgi:molybdopterin synthase sulfur carrier subunit